MLNIIHFLLRKIGFLKARYLKYKYQNILLSVEEIYKISEAINKRKACNYLVFGLGNDALLWLEVNRGGYTVFLENSQEWIDKFITKRNMRELIYKITYTTRITQWRELLDCPEKLELKLPEEVINLKWDVILVDAPMGGMMQDTAPESGAVIHGRMQSIYMAARLAGKGCTVFVHDTERVVEKTYCDKYFPKEKLTCEMGRGGWRKKSSLRCYELKIIIVCLWATACF